MAKTIEKRGSSSRTTSLRRVFNQAVLIFVIGCVFGTFWEEIMCLVKNFYTTGTWQWVSRRGLLYGPFSPVYGLGAVLIYFVFYRTKLGLVPCFIGGAILGGAIEIVLNILQEQMFGTVSWDYSDRFLNIAGGRTTIPYMLVWGLLVAIFSYYVMPWLDRLYEGLSGRAMNWICVGLAVFLILDIGISLVASLRQGMRRAGNPADTPIEMFLDEVYDDERMKKTYDNARYVRNS